MDFVIRKNSDFTLIKVQSDRLDTSNAPDLKAELVLIVSNGEKNIVLDISECEYCDTSGLSAILLGNRLCEEATGNFILTGLRPDVEFIISISMIHTVIIVTRTIEEAENILAENIKK